MQQPLVKEKYLNLKLSDLQSQNVTLTVSFSVKLTHRILMVV